MVWGTGNPNLHNTSWNASSLTRTAGIAKPTPCPAAEATETACAWSCLLMTLPKTSTWTAISPVAVAAAAACATPERQNWSKNSGVAAAAGAAAPWAATPERQRSNTRLAPGWDGRGNGLAGLGSGTPELEDEAGDGLDGCGGELDGLGAGTAELDDEDRGSALVRGSNMTCLALALAFPGICLGIAGRGRSKSFFRCVDKTVSPSRSAKTFCNPISSFFRNTTCLSFCVKPCRPSKYFSHPCSYGMPSRHATSKEQNAPLR